MEGIASKSIEEEKMEKRKPKQMKKMWKKQKTQPRLIENTKLSEMSPHRSEP